MDFSNLMNAIGVKLTPVELTPECTVYIKLPNITQHVECADPYKAIFYCVLMRMVNRFLIHQNKLKKK
jgi:hypothetical protein